jgi:ABC-type sugar transport system substrate-binding protein
MKKFIALLLSLVLVFAFAACATAPAPAADPEPEPEPEVEVEVEVEAEEEDDELPNGTAVVEYGDWMIGIVTGTVSQGEEEYLASANMEDRFGSDRIVRATYPDDFGAEQATTIANVLALIDAGADAIVFVQAVPGAIPAINQAADLFGDDILFVAGVPHDPPEEISAAADVVLIADDLAMGRVIVEQAAAMGADTFAHISFPRHLGMENIAARREIAMSYAEELGLDWVELTAPDPMSEGVATAQLFIMENVPRWIEEHGENTAFFSTNCGMQEPLMTQIANYGGFYPLQCCASPLHAFPAAFNVSIPPEHAGDMVFLVDAIRDAVADAGGEGRFSTWPVPINMLFVEVGVLYAIEYLEGRTDGRHDSAVITRLLNEVAAEYGGVLEISNWPLEDGGVIDNMYRVLSGFVNF